MPIALINGKIYTLDNQNSIAEAIAIENNTIHQIGTTNDIQSSGLAFDRVIDLHGKTVLPGFIDGHTHLGHSGLESLWVDLSKTSSTEEILELLKIRIEKTPAGEWVVGVMYDDAGWRYQECLTKDSLDELSTEHPIFLRRVCGHYGVVNSKTLEQISTDWKYVDRETGVLLEDAVLGFMRIIKPDLNTRTEGIRKVMENAYSLGLTAIREVVNFQSVQSYHHLDKNNELELRIFAYVIYDDLMDFFAKYPDRSIDSNNFKIIGVKLFLDGSLGARTAALKEPYSDDPDNYGKLLHSDEELQNIFGDIKTIGYSLMAHAIGDRAIQQFVEIYKKVFSDEIPDNPKMHSLEHVEVIDSELLDELKNLGIVVSAQPNFAGRWSNPGGLNEQRLGKKRLMRCNAYKEFINKEIPVVFGSDSMPLDPIFGLRSAVFHPIKNQSVTPLEAVKAYTQNCYKIFKLDSKFGSIEPGKMADLVILTNDPIEEPNFDKIKIAGTIINGKIVYSNGLD
jgi:predicted amidohydrolase YtcJ